MPAADRGDERLTLALTDPDAVLAAEARGDLSTLAADLLADPASLHRVAGAGADLATSADPDTGATASAEATAARAAGLDERAGGRSDPGAGASAAGLARSRPAAHTGADGAGGMGAGSPAAVPPLPVPPGDDAADEARLALTDDPTVSVAPAAAADAERRQVQRDAIVWTVVPLVLLAMGLWLYATRSRAHRKRSRRRSPRQRA